MLAMTKSDGGVVIDQPGETLISNAARSDATPDSLFGSPLVLSRVHWVQPELVA